MLAQIANILLGLWLMVAPAVLGHAGAAAKNDWIVGPLVVTVATVALWQATRAVRWVNLVLGAWMVLAAWLLGYGRLAAVLTTAVGLAIALLAIPRGRITHQFDGGWRVLREARPS